MLINPFLPRKLVDAERFAGRSWERKRLVSLLEHTIAGSADNFLLTGDRGIGKSSLLKFIRELARGSRLSDGAKPHRCLVVEARIDPSTTQLGLAKQIERGIREELANAETIRAALDKLWGFASRVEALGVGLKQAAPAAVDSDMLVRDLSYSLSQTVNRVCSNSLDAGITSAAFDAVLITIDEADSAHQDLHLGGFLKSLMESLDGRGCSKVMFGVAGLPTVGRVLRQSHPSSPRLFEELRLSPLTDSEVSDVIDRCMSTALRMNPAATAIDMDREARSLLIDLSEGYPHFIQQFGHSAFERSGNGHVTLSHVFHGAYAQKGGGLYLIGHSYYRGMFYDDVNEDGRHLLKILSGAATDKEPWVSKDELQNRWEKSRQILGSTLRSLLSKGAIIEEEGVPGSYRLHSRAFGLWILNSTRTEAEAREKLIDSKPRRGQKPSTLS